MSDNVYEVVCKLPKRGAVRKGSDKHCFPKVGMAFKESNGSISVKLDTMPLDCRGWDGTFILYPRS